MEDCACSGAGHSIIKFTFNHVCMVKTMNRSGDGMDSLKLWKIWSPTNLTFWKVIQMFTYYLTMITKHVLKLLIEIREVKVSSNAIEDCTCSGAGHSIIKFTFNCVW